MQTFWVQVDVLIWTSFRVVHEFPHDDSEAVDVTFGCSITWKTNVSQKLRGHPVQIYNKFKRCHVHSRHSL